MSTPLTLNGIGSTASGVARPAIYGDGSGGVYTLSGQITLAASSDVGNSKNNSTLSITGKITGPGGLTVGCMAATAGTQSGTVTIGGATSNDYTGGTTIARGTVYLQKTDGATAIPGDVTLTAGGVSGGGVWSSYLVLKGPNQISSTAVMNFTAARSCHGYFELLGNDQTLAGINDPTVSGIIENAEQETGINNLATLTINNTADFTYYGRIRNGDLAANGASTGLLAVVKSGPGTLTLASWIGDSYTGGLTVNAGTLDYSAAATLPGTPVAYPTGPTGPTSPASITPCPYTINGGILNIGSLSASIGTFKISGGTLSGNGTLASNATFDVRGGRVDANLAGNAIGVTKSGAGLAVLTGMNSYTGCTTVSGGVLELGPSAQSCVLNVGGADIQSGALLFDYAGASDPAATIGGLLSASSHSGLWDVGQFRDSTAALTGLTLGWLDDKSSSQVKVMATYPGDFNLDGVVDNLDRAIWCANAFMGTSWQQGDANGDGVVDGLDRDLWFSHVGLPSLAGVLPAASITPAPEPGTLALLAAGLLGLLAYGWRKRK